MLLMVLAPEEPGRDQATRVLFNSGEIRQASRIEQCLISIPAEVLKQAGVPLPIDPSAATPDTRTSINKLSQAVGQRLEFQDGARKLAAQQITRVRAEAEETDLVVERRLIETLTGVTEAQAKRLNIVMPGGDVQDTTWSTVNKNIEERINAGPLVGHVVLTERQAAGFRDGSGNYRNNIPAERIEPDLYRGRNQTERQGFILRDDPVEALCRAANQPPLSESASGGTGSGSGSGSGGASGSGSGAGSNGSGNGAGGIITLSELPPLTKEDLPKFVGRLISDMIPPPNGAHATNGQRPDAADVQSSIEGLQLKSGPADVTAFYDFHQLQIAFDYVWQQAIDEGVLETGKALTRQLIERGGDPLPALTNSKDPIRALRREAAHVALAQSQMLGIGVAYRPASTRPPGDITGDLSQPPGVPPLPPLPPQPPRHPLGDIVVHPGDLAIDTEPRDLLDMLDDMLQECYKFETFAPGSCNFGLLVTYRQKWQPVTYQVGDLVKTLTLAPKETRKVSTKRMIKKERSRKEMEANQRNRKDETSHTMRDEAEIVQKAQDKTNFSMNAKGSYNIGISKGDSNTTFSRDAELSSQETKKSFHEAVIKAAQEFRDERKIEVETKETDEQEIVDSVEIANPNDELTVTYLFYELQRRFLVSESIHKITPVVLAGMKVTNPNRWAIDRILLGHSWVINRVLLDDRYRPALDYLCNSIVGDERALQQLSANLATVRAAVEQLKTMHKDMQATLSAREAAYQAAIEARAGKVGATEGEGIGEKAWEFIAGSGDEEDVEAARILEDQKKEAYERSVREEKDLRMRLDAETAALTDATEAYARAQAEHANQPAADRRPARALQGEHALLHAGDLQLHVPGSDLLPDEHHQGAKAHAGAENLQSRRAGAAAAGDRAEARRDRAQGAWRREAQRQSHTRAGLLDAGRDRQPRQAGRLQGQLHDLRA